jgi:putative tryptophan/tyrosine transport system substrate-binding protein
MHNRFSLAKPRSNFYMNIKRFAVLALVASVATLTGGISQAQQAAKVYRVGVLQNRVPGPEFEVLKKELARLGYVEGTNIIFESRFAEGKLDRLPGFAAELVSTNVDVIATYGGPPTSAARKATTTIPIVAALVADPVAIGAAATLVRPGGNVTGITNHDSLRATRQLAILKEVFPKLARVAFLSDADIPGADASGFAPLERDNITAAAAMNIRPQTLKLRGPAPDLVAALDSIVSEKADVIVVMEVPVTILTRGRIVELATARRIPTLFWGGVSDAGVLMSYGTTIADTYPRMPLVVDKILKGAKPADTPFEEITRQEFVVNLKVARELGVTIPPEVLKRADRVIE